MLCIYIFDIVYVIHRSSAYPVAASHWLVALVITACCMEWSMMEMEVCQANPSDLYTLNIQYNYRYIYIAKMGSYSKYIDLLGGRGVVIHQQYMPKTSNNYDPVQLQIQIQIYRLSYGYICRV